MMMYLKRNEYDIILLRLPPHCPILNHPKLEYPPILIIIAQSPSSLIMYKFYRIMISSRVPLHRHDKLHAGGQVGPHDLRELGFDGHHPLGVAVSDGEHEGGLVASPPEDSPDPDLFDDLVVLHDVDPLGFDVEFGVALGREGDGHEQGRYVAVTEELESDLVAVELLVLDGEFVHFFDVLLFGLVVLDSPEGDDEVYVKIRLGGLHHGRAF